MRSADPIHGMRSLDCYRVKPAKRGVKVPLDVLLNENDPQNIWLRKNLVNEIG